jgi:hypothetical protein
VGQRRKAAPFGIREAKATTAELRFENTVFLVQIGDNLVLVPLDPPGNHGNQDVENHRCSSG